MGVSALTGIAAASAYYYATRPLPEVPLVPLHNQSPILEVSFHAFNVLFNFMENSLSFVIKYCSFILTNLYHGAILTLKL